jgi:hypothetical protein
VRDHRGVQPDDGARPLAAAVRFQAELHASREQDLHADAHPEHRPPAATRSAMILSPPIFRRPVMHASNAPTPGTTRPSALRPRRVGGHFDVGADPLQRALGRPQVAGAVVETRRTFAVTACLWWTARR